MTNTPTDAYTHILISPDVLFQDLDGEAVLLNLATEKYFSLDDVGTRMWQLMGKYGDIERTLAQLIAEYDVDPQTLRQDLNALIGKLVEAGLIQSAT